jgi:gamma-glutamyltranspeptidase/glutathione hydrolase
MPAAATPARFGSLGLRQIPGSGLLPACVPGAFGAWVRLLAELGSLPLARILEPAIAYARGGYPLVAEAARAIATMSPLFETEWVESGRTFLPGGRAPAPGHRLRNVALGDTLARIVDEAEAASTDHQAQCEAARHAFYEGFVAEAIDGFVASTPVLDATGERHRGLLTADDLASWRATVEAPASVAFHGLTVHKPSFWSQGPVFLQQLALLEDVDLAGAGLTSGPYVHALVEASRLAFADREGWYGDPDHVDVDPAALLDPAYAAARRELLGEKALAAPEPGVLGGRTSWAVTPPAPDPCARPVTTWLDQLHGGMPTIVLRETVKAGDTCTVAVADRHGNLAAAVPSGGWLKSSPVVPGLGFPLGTRGQTLWLVDGHPNSLAPGKRPRTTLSPTVVLRDGDPYLAFGTPGGDRQDVWTLEAFLAATEFGLDLQAATEVTMFHSDEFPSSFTPHGCRPGVVVIEDDCDPATVADLQGRGHEVALVGAGTLGKVCMVGVDGDQGFVKAGAGPRGRQAYAVAR